MMSPFGPRGGVEVSQGMITGLQLNTSIMLLTPKLAAQARLLCFWRKSALGDLAVAACAVPRVWSFVGGKKKIGTMWKGQEKIMISKKWDGAVLPCQLQFLQAKLFIWLAMATTTTDTRPSWVAVELCFILSFQKEPNSMEVFLKRRFCASLCLSRGHPGPCYKGSTTELATKLVGFCCDCVTVGLLCTQHNRTQCVLCRSQCCITVR